jgi:uracil-DNA glycosylase
MDNIHESWKPLFDKYNFNLEDLYNSGDVVYPKQEHIFRVFEMDVKDIKVLLLGQDPYHNPDQANGLSFSVQTDMKIPPSLLNIYKELRIEFPERNYTWFSGNLERWFYKEKIFLLNASLTVVKNHPGSHMDIWKDFTNDVIKYINDNNNKCIFLLLGKFAKTKEIFITNKENIVTGIHPSPLSAHNGFFGSNVFKLVEEKLGHEIDWNVFYV